MSSQTLDFWGIMVGVTSGELECTRNLEVSQSH